MLYNKTFYLNPIMSSNNNQNAAEKYNFCNSQLGTTSEKFIWTIENFSKHKECGKSLQSTEYITLTSKGQILKWQMRMYPNGHEEEAKDYVAFFLLRVDSINEEVEAKHHFSIRKSNGDEFISRTYGYHKYGYPGPKNWGYNKVIKREDLLNAENGYLDGDRLTIVCGLIIKQKSVNNVEVPECRGMEDVSHLFEESQFWDCKIIADDRKKEFKVHKCILGCRSSVFGAMFQHQMTENNDNIIDIKDVRGEVIEKMLRYIYSGKEPDFGEMAEELLAAADKYELIRLKLFCERKLINSLGNENACALLSLANLHSAKHLKASAIDFIKMNLKEVMESEGWKTFANEPSTMEQILKAIAK